MLTNQVEIVRKVCHWEIIVGKPSDLRNQKIAWKICKISRRYTVSVALIQSVFSVIERGIEYMYIYIECSQNNEQYLKIYCINMSSKMLGF